MSYLMLISFTLTSRQTSVEIQVQNFGILHDSQNTIIGTLMKCCDDDDNGNGNDDINR